MAYQGSDLLNSLQQYHPDINLQGIGSLSDAANQAAAAGMDPASFAAKYQNDPSILNAYIQKYTNLAQPNIANINEQIGIAGEQGTNAANTQNLNTQNTKYGIQQSQLDQNQSLFNQADQMGLSRSGVTGAGTGRIAANTQQALSYTDAQNANALAQIAIQQQGTQGALRGSLSQIQQGISSNAQQQYDQDTAGAQANRVSALGALQNINLALAATSPSYLNLLNTTLQKAGLGAITSSELASYAQSAVKNAGGSIGSSGSTGGTSVPSQPQQGQQLDQSSTVGNGKATLSQIQNYVQNIFKDIPQSQLNAKPGANGAFTENLLFPQLENLYGLSNSQAASIVYPIRQNYWKSFF